MSGRSSDDANLTDGDIITVLNSEGILLDSNDDLTLTDSFRTDWRRRIDQVAEDPTTYLGLLVEADPESLAVDDDEGGIAVRDESGSITRTVGEWPSEAALVADVAAFVSLGEWLPEFEALDGVERDELVARLRVFLEACPSCGGELEERAGSGDAATAEVSVPDVSCADCGAALF